MNTSFENGAVLAHGKLYEEAKYDVSNYTLSACFNGCGGIDYYLPINSEKFDVPASFISIVYNGEMQNVLLDKKVTMIGRMQTIEIFLSAGAFIKIEQFLSEKEYGVFTKYSLVSDNKNDVCEIGIFGNFFTDMNKQESVLYAENREFTAERDFSYIPENQSICFELDRGASEFRFHLTYCQKSESTRAFSDFFDTAFATEKNAISAVAVPSGLNDTEKALFTSCYWCALENYKELGDYKAFMAGCRYLSPVRSYYRDSYYTILPMYRNNIDKVKNQILTLARGIEPDGSCPSAVKSNWEAWWGNHYDSPSFFAIMLYDYINFSGDLSFADTEISGRTLFENAVSAVAHLSSYSDKTGLLVKSGEYNKLDWADEVNRYGYVTYDEILYARALESISNIYSLKGETEKSSIYAAKYEKVKKAINDLLWDDEKGYYINFTNDDYTEDNLSIDTVFAAIFDIADEKRAVRMLSNMEKMLETENNNFGENFGSMCVYPFYKKLTAFRNKSTQSFNYHNGANWPYLSAMYAYAKRKFGMEYKSILSLPFEYNIKKGNYNQIEYFSPFCKDGSLLQAWSGVTAFVLDEELSADFWQKNKSVFPNR